MNRAVAKTAPVVLLTVMLSTGCATPRHEVATPRHRAPTPTVSIPGPLAPCVSQPPPPPELLACEDARQKGAPWLPKDMQAQLDWYRHHEDSTSIEAWVFTRGTIEHSSSLMGGSPGSCAYGEEGTVVDAHTGEFIVEGFNGSTPTPCPSG